MSPNSLSLFVFIDALGWEIVQRRPWFLQKNAPHKKRLRTIFGYSSACDPSIISGKLPYQHGLWSSYYYSPHTSPFGPLRYLGYLPSAVMQSARVRGRLSQILAKWYGFTGYFQLYNIPFAHLHYFDYAEKKRIYSPHGLPNAKSIFDVMSEEKIPYHVCAAGYNDLFKLDALIRDFSTRRVRLGYITLGKLDATLHGHGTQSKKVDGLLNWYEGQIERLFQAASKAYEEVSLYIFSDHGMHDVVHSYDLQSKIQSLGLAYGQDYVAMYDSTMARFWFLHKDAQEKIHKALDKVDCGRILSEQELKEFGVFFPDGRYGQTIFLMDSSALIVPSYMGRKKIPGMHGYHPDDKESYAAILSNQKLPKTLTSIQHIYYLMEQKIY